MTTASLLIFAGLLLALWLACLAALHRILKHGEGARATAEDFCAWHRGDDPLPWPAEPTQAQIDSLGCPTCGLKHAAIFCDECGKWFVAWQEKGDGA